MNKPLPGAPIRVQYVCSTGSHTNHYGVGELDISIRRPGDYPWLDVGNVFFSSPTQSQLTELNAGEDTPGKSIFRSNIPRRMSRDQAELVALVIMKELTEKFTDGIPPDDEITEWKKAYGF